MSTAETLAVKRRQRLDKKRRTTLPLFAASGQIDEVAPLPDVDTIAGEYRQMQAQVCLRVLGMQVKSLRMCLYYRGLVEQYLTWDQVQHMQHYAARVLPDDCRGGYWLKVALDLGIERRRANEWLDWWQGRVA